MSGRLEMKNSYKNSEAAAVGWDMTNTCSATLTEVLT